MKEERKEEPMKQVETYDLDLSVSRDAGWARCPICNDVWRLGYFVYPWYAVWIKSYNPSNVSKQPQLCPIHMEEIIVDGRAKGQRTVLNQDQLKEMSECGLHCPACEEGALEKDSIEAYSWTCRRCRASVIIEQLVTSDGRIEIKYCSFRRDLGIKKPMPLFPVPWGLLEHDTYKLKKM